MNIKNICAGLAIFLLFGSASAWACDHCRPLVESGVYNPDFIVNFSLLMLPLGVLVALGVISHHMDAIWSGLPSRKGTKHHE